MAAIRHRRVPTNGIHLHVAEAGAGPLVLLLHGFPESWYSWRHQIEPLAAAGYHVVAPDMRGYGTSDHPPAIATYNQVNVTADIVGLIATLGHDTAAVIGHDWGAPTAWYSALLYPEHVVAVGALSVPYTPRAAALPLQRLKQVFKTQFFYQLYFQEPGKAEADLEADIRTFLRKFIYTIAGEAPLNAMAAPKAPTEKLLDGMTDPPALPSWLTDEDLAFYVAEFERSGLSGPLNYYRNHNLTWALTTSLAGARVRQPALFAAGDRDPVIMWGDALLRLPENVTDLRVNALLPGCGHWTQQERPNDITRLILEFLRQLDLR